MGYIVRWKGCLRVTPVKDAVKKVWSEANRNLTCFLTLDPETGKLAPGEPNKDYPDRIIPLLGDLWDALDAAGAKLRGKLEWQEQEYDCQCGKVVVSGLGVQTRKPVLTWGPPSEGHFAERRRLEAAKNKKRQLDELVAIHGPAIAGALATASPAKRAKCEEVDE